MINNPRFEEHYQYQLSSEISERIDLNKELGDMEEDYEQMYTQYEMEQRVTNYHGILGEVVSVDNQTMYVENMRKINLMGNIVIEYRGIVASEYGGTYFKDVWLSNTVMHLDTAIDFLEKRIDWFDKTMLVPVEFRNDRYRYYTLMSLEAYLIQTKDNYINSEPAYLCSLDDIDSSKPKYFHPDFQDMDDFINGQSYADHLLDIANGNDYEGEYKLNYESYCVVASQFDSCDFYGIAVEVSSVTTYSNQDEIIYLDDDLPF